MRTFDDEYGGVGLELIREDCGTPQKYICQAPSLVDLPPMDMPPMDDMHPMHDMPPMEPPMYGDMPAYDDMNARPGDVHGPVDPDMSWNADLPA